MLEDAFVVRDVRAPSLDAVPAQRRCSSPARRPVRPAAPRRSPAPQPRCGVPTATYGVAASDRVVQAGDTAFVLASAGGSASLGVRVGRDLALRDLAPGRRKTTDQARQSTEPATRTPQLGRPAARRKSGQGEAIWWFGALTEIKATAEDTGGQMTILEMTEPPVPRPPGTSIAARTRPSGSSRKT